MTKADGPFRIIGVQQHTLIINENFVPNTISIDQAVPARPSNTDAIVAKERNAIEYGVTVDKEHQACESKVAKSEWCETDDRRTLLKPEVSGQREYQPLKQKVQEDGGTTAIDEEQKTPE